MSNKKSIHIKLSFCLKNEKVNSRFTLTIQDGGVIPTGIVYVFARTVGTSFEIRSTAADSGLIVYYQIWEQAV